MVNLGVWIDDSVKSVRSPKFWDDFKEHGFETAGVMLESVKGGFDPKYDTRTLEDIRSHALSRDIEVVITVWPEPSKAYLEELELKIGPMLEASGAAGIEFDCEGNWLKGGLRGYPSLEAASQAFVESFRRISLRYDVRTELTTYPYHAENGKSALVAPHCGRILPQAYSVRKRSSGDVDWDSRFGPGGMQRLTMDRALRVPGVGQNSGPLVGCALAAYDQTWPDRDPSEAMQVAYDAAMTYNPIEIRYWSSKWIFGARANGYASKFIKGLKKPG
jgi:hypothetical protein